MKYYHLLILGTFLLASCAKPIAKFTADQQTTKVPGKVSFSNMSEKAESYTWDFGDGNISTDPNPSHKYYLSGKYSVKLIAEKDGKKDEYFVDLIFDAPEICLVEINTSFGPMLVQLSDSTPKHRDNFLKLAEENFYNDLLFHRVINGFMIQGGDPNSKNASENSSLGSGGPGYTVEAEFNPEQLHYKGALAAARQGDNVNPEKRSSGSQFYIVHGKPVNPESLMSIGNRNGLDYTTEQIEKYAANGGTPFLDNNYTVFGQVIKGMEVIDKIAAVKKNSRDRPIEDVKILSVKVIK
jgi:peptidyl-prolyl cis-trans isomerase B (cyclophilin B)